MSILQDYERAKSLLGEKVWQQIDEFLSAKNGIGEEIYLSDVLYNQKAWLEFEKWVATDSKKEKTK